MSASVNLEATFHVGQNSVNLSATFHVGQDSEDLKAFYMQKPQAALAVIQGVSAGVYVELTVVA